MYKGAKPMYHKRSKPHREYQDYSVSQTSLGSSTWRYYDEMKRKRVQFDTDYDYSMQGDYYAGGRRNVHSYSYLYDPSTEYDTGDEVREYYESQDGLYTRYHKPQKIMYTESDSMFTTVESDYENRNYGYRSYNQPKYRQRYGQSSNKNGTVPTKTRDTQTSSYEEDSNVYFVQEPPRHNTFGYKQATIHDVSNTSEAEFHSESVTETEEETAHDRDGKRENVGNQVYVTNIVENETKSVFQKDLPKSREILISVTDYDDISLLALKNTNLPPQKAISRVVYLPILVTGMQNNTNELFPTNIGGNNLLPTKNNKENEAEKPKQSLKVYATTNTGQNNIFSSKNCDDSQNLNKTSGSKHINSSVVIGENIKSNQSGAKFIRRKSFGRPVSRTSSGHLQSILKIHAANPSKSLINSPEITSQPNQPSKQKINKGSNITDISEKPISMAKNTRGSRISRKDQGKKSLDSNKKSNEYKENKWITKTKSNISISSTKSSNHRLLIGETPPGSQKGSSYYHEAHQRELQARKEAARKSKQIQETKTSAFEVAQRQDQQSVSRINKSNTNINVTNNLSSKKLTESKVTSDTDLKTNQPRITTDKSESAHTRTEIDKKDNRKSVSKASTIKPLPKKMSVIETIDIYDGFTRDADKKNRGFGEKSDVVVASGTKKGDGDKSTTKSSTILNIFRRKNAIADQDMTKLSGLGSTEGKTHDESSQLNTNKTVQDITKSVTINRPTAGDSNTSLPQKSVLQIHGVIPALEQKTAKNSLIKIQYSDASKPDEGGGKLLLKQCSSDIIGNEPITAINSIQDQNIDVTIKQDVKEESKWSSMNPYQIVEGRKSVLNESMISRDDKPVMLIPGNNMVLEQTKVEDIRPKSIYSGKNSSVQGSRNTLAKQSPNQQTQSITKSLVNQNEPFGEPTKMPEVSKERQYITGEEVKSILRTKSQDQPNKNKVNENATREIKSTVERKSEVFQHQRKDKIVEEVNKSLVAKGFKDEKDKSSFITQVHPTASEKKTAIGEIKVSNQEEQAGRKSSVIGRKSSVIGGKSSVIGGKSSVIGRKSSVIKAEKIESKVDEKPTKSSVSEGNSKDEDKTLIKEKLSLKLNRSSNQNEMSDASHLHLIEEERKSSINPQKKMSEKTSIISDRNKSNRVSHQEKVSKVKQTSKITEIERTEEFYPTMKLWGYDFSTFMTLCFQISQFIIGVSTYDKFIEVMGNFHNER